MGLFDEKTHWVFLWTTCGPLHREDRHLHDVRFGIISLLETRRINAEFISLVVDDKNYINQLKLILQDINKNINIFVIGDLNSYIINNEFENLVLFVHGHGSMDGLPCSRPITPYKLFSYIKHIRKLKRAVVYLGQCYAGIFNYMDVSSKTNEKGELVSPEIIVVGATDLFSSISSSILADIEQCAHVRWQANLFFYFLFEWIRSPQDVDGDRKCTVMDSYKYTGAKTNDICSFLKNKRFPTILSLHKKLDNAMEKINSGNLDAMEKEELENEKISIETRITDMLNIQYIHQEPWILNAIPAQFIEF